MGWSGSWNLACIVAETLNNQDIENLTKSAGGELWEDRGPGDVRLRGAVCSRTSVWSGTQMQYIP